MSITDELRKYANRFKNSHDAWSGIGDDLTAIADRIDAEHESACAEAYGNGVMSVPIALDESAWVELPKDADGVPFHIGELVDEMLPFGGYAAPAPIDTMELSRGASGYVWMMKLDAENRALISPKLLRHHHVPTVEDVLREFANEVYADADNEIRDRDFLCAKYAKRLRLAKEDA